MRLAAALVVAIGHRAEALLSRRAIHAGQPSALARRRNRADARKLAARDDEASRDRNRVDAEKAREDIEREKREDRVYYTAGGSSGRERWLVEFAGDKIAAAPLGRAQKPTVFAASRSGDNDDEALGRFLAWARSDVPDAYFLIVVRPSAYRRLDKVQVAFRSPRRNFGFDLIGEAKKVLEDEKGAGPP